MKDKISLIGAISVGIGGMVGGGIFAVLGLAASMAKGGTPVAFLIAGLIALVTAYSYVKLSLTFPDRGGTVRFINEGFGRNTISGGTNNLLWVSYIIMLSLYASAFGSYAPNLLPNFSESFDFHFYTSLVVIFATAINYTSVKLVGNIESYAVIVKLVILIAFVLVGLYGLSQSSHTDQLSIGSWESPLQLLAAGMVIFVAYEGFELIANVVPDLKDPERNVPRAYYFSVLFVIVLYILIAVISVGSLSFSELAEAEDYALAEAAKPMLGKVGFTIITIAALISTFSAINASLYGGSRVSYELAEDQELPHQLHMQLWNHPIGLAITTVLTLIVANSLDLKDISVAGSVGFLTVFSAVNYSGWKLADSIDGNKLYSGAGLLLCLAALITLIFQQITSDQPGIYIALLLLVACFLLEWAYRRFSSDFKN